MTQRQPDLVIIVSAWCEATYPEGILIRLRFGEAVPGPVDDDFSTVSLPAACRRIERYLARCAEG